MSVIETEVVVIGAGPGGYPAAFGCADHGKQVVMVDQDPQPGGVCLNRGCIPSKALLHLSKLIEEAKEASHAGVSFGPPQIDLAKVRISALMTRQVYTCTPDTSIEELMRQMTLRRIRHLPVLREGRLCGIISIGDVVNHRLMELETETSTMRDYIGGR